MPNSQLASHQDAISVANLYLQAVEKPGIKESGGDGHRPLSLAISESAIILTTTIPPSDTQQGQTAR
jgi:hypothetical protein